MLRNTGVAFCAVLVFASLLSGCSGPSLSSDATTTSTVVEAQAARAALANSGKFYLELRLGEKAVHLCHSGASLRRYPVKNLLIGTPRFLFFPRGDATTWVNRVWPHGQAYPTRVVNRVRIIPGDEKTRPTPDSAEFVPPNLPDLIPVPPLWRLRFNDGLGLQVELLGKVPGAEGNDGYGGKWREFLEGAWLRQAVRLQIKLELDAADGASLYRSMPENPDLLVIE